MITMVTPSEFSSDTRLKHSAWERYPEGVRIVGTRPPELRLIDFILAY